MIGMILLSSVLPEVLRSWFLRYFRIERRALPSSAGASRFRPPEGSLLRTFVVSHTRFP